MDGGIRRSQRKVKIKKNSDFYYEEDLLEALTPSNTTWQPNNSVCLEAPPRLANEPSLSEINSCVWSDNIIFATDKYHKSAQDYLKLSAQDYISDSDSSSQYTSSDTAISGACALTTGFVNKPSEAGVRERKNSSTRQDFLDLEGNFLSESAISISSDMSGSENEDLQGESPVTEAVNPSLISVPVDDSLTKAIYTTLGKMETLTDEVAGLKRVLVSQIDRLHGVEENVRQLARRVTEPSSGTLGTVPSSGTLSAVPSSGTLGAQGQDPVRNRIQQQYSNLNLPAPIRVEPSKRRRDRVEFERERTLNILLDKLTTRDQPDTATSDNNTADELDLLGLKKSMPRLLREESSRRAAQRLEESGAMFPAEEVQVSSASGMESDERSSSSVRRRRKVKSGAEVKIRPVKKTELWPHTIANEQDGEDATCDNISLAKFLASATLIVTKTRGIESSGRSLLLHATMVVLGCLPWTEARLFHNLVMIKLEQARIRWDTDFTILANEFIDRKVRQSLKSKSQATGGGSSRSGNQGQGKGYGNCNPNPKGKSSAYALVCYQWNESTCTYGAKCKRWHVCRTCAEAGKPGEDHKSINCSNKGKQGEK